MAKSLADQTSPTAPARLSASATRELVPHLAEASLSPWSSEQAPSVSCRDTASRRAAGHRSEEAPDVSQPRRAEWGRIHPRGTGALPSRATIAALHLLEVSRWLPPPDSVWIRWPTQPHPK